MSKSKVDVFKTCAKGRSGIYAFDLGRISQDQLQLLIAKIQDANFPSDFQGFVFNMESVKGEKDGLTFRSTKSRAVQNQQFFRLLFTAVNKVIGHVTFLKFKFIKPDIDSLSNAIYSPICKQLRTLKFSSVQLGDSGFERLCRSFRKQCLNEIVFKNVGLTDKSGFILHSLLNYHIFVKADSKECIQKVSVQNNNLTNDFLKAMEASLIDLQLVSLDVRGNPSITERYVYLLQKATPKTKIFYNNPKVITKSKKRGEDVVEIEPGLFLVGKRASEFAAQLKRVNEAYKEHERRAVSSRKETNRKSVYFFH